MMIMARGKTDDRWTSSLGGCGVGVNVWIVLLLLTSLPGAVALGGEIATLTTPLLTSLGNHTHRQNVCHRYDMFRSGQIELRDALEGIALQPLMALGDFFNYDPQKGISREDPGLIADLMDALAERAKFTWRDSFAVMEEPETLNQTWTNMLLWGVENYDVAVNWWDQSVERMSRGVAYIEPWFDGSVILIDQKDPPVDVNTIVVFNWMLPFELNVWALTLFTILLSALIYQFIEFLHHERDDRPIGQWFADNLYLSSLNFTQNFEYAPNSVAGRIFSVSMSVWALIMTATYTANLASLFVQEQQPALVVDSIDQAIMLGIPICTMGLTNSDSMIKERHVDAKRIPKATELEAYQALRRGECGLYAAYKDNWLGYRGNSEYNPECDLEWVGRVVATIKSGFAVKADAGHLCSSLIRDVLNLHMVELISEGTLGTAWEKHRSKTNDQDCDVEESETRRRRLLGYKNQDETTTGNNYHRRMKGAKSAASASSSSSSSQSSLTLQQMMGTFACHWAVMAFAILVGILTRLFSKRDFDNLDQSVKSIERVTYRRHGPIIGSPPPVNTSMISRRHLFAPTRDLGLSTISESLDNGSTKHQRRLSTIAEGLDESSSKHNQRRRDSSSEPDWRQSHAALELKQHDLSQQMNSVMLILQEMREEQQQVLLQQKQLLQRGSDDDMVSSQLGEMHRFESLGFVQPIEECAPKNNNNNNNNNSATGKKVFTRGISTLKGDMDSDEFVKSVESCFSSKNPF